MKCLLLGAGYATRLYPLTQDRPKPLLPVGGVPILQRLCEQVFKVRAVDHVYLVTNHRFAPQYDHWLREYRSQRALPVPFEILDDLSTSPEDRLGAIGDIDFVLRNAKIDDDLLVLAGDNLFQFPLQGFLDAVPAGGTGVCLKDLGSKKQVSLYGAVEVDANGRVAGFEEKPPLPRTTLVSIGVYLFGRTHLPLFRQYLEEGCRKDAPGYFLQWLHPRVEVRGHVVAGEWFDIGDLDSYNQANEMMKKGSGS